MRRKSSWPLLVYVRDAAGARQTFDYTFCNKTGQVFCIATWWRRRQALHAAVDDGRYCANIGAFPKGWAYYYAEQDEPGTARWEADDVGICVEYPGPFERILTPNYSCGSNQKIQGFKSIFVDADSASVTITLDPPG